MAFSLGNIFTRLATGGLVVIVANFLRFFIADLLRLIHTNRLGLVPVHLSGDVVADLLRHLPLHHLGDVPELQLGVADLSVDGVALLLGSVVGDLPVLAQLLVNPPLHLVLHIMTQLGGTFFQLSTRTALH